MPTAVERLQQMLDNTDYVLNLMTQAEQACEQIHAWAEEHVAGDPNPPDIMAAIKALKDQIKITTEHHNALVGKLQNAKHEAEQKEAEQPAQ